MATIASGQLTVFDYNDTINLQPYISSNQGRTQIYDPDAQTYSPDWTSGPYMILTASLFKGTSGGSIEMIGSPDGTGTCTGVVWKYRDASNTLQTVTIDSNHVLSGTANRTLTIKVNDLSSVVSKTYVAEMTFHDNATTQDIVYSFDITFQKTISGNGLVTAMVSPPNGTIFYLGTPATLSLHCDLFKGSSVDSTGNTYAWFIADSTIVSGTAPTGLNWTPQNFPGWRKLSDTANTYTGTNTADLVVYPTAINAWGIFKCIVIDGDTGKFYYDQIPISDQSDTLQLTVLSIGGNILKNGSGGLVLYAQVKQGSNFYDEAPFYSNGQLVSSIATPVKPTSPVTNQYWLDLSWAGSTPTNITNGTAGYGTLYKYNGSTWVSQTWTSGTGNTYTWVNYDQNGNVITTWPAIGPTTKTSKWVFITDPDVTNKSTFTCTMS